MCSGRCWTLGGKDGRGGNLVPVLDIRISSRYLFISALLCINFLETDDKRKKTEAKINAFSYIGKTYQIICSGHIHTSLRMTFIHGRRYLSTKCGEQCLLFCTGLLI
jgi:hypothetical protein